MIITMESTIPDVDPTFKVKAECKALRSCNGKVQLTVKIKPDQVYMLGFPWFVVRAVTHEDGYVYMPVSTGTSQILFW